MADTQKSILRTVSPWKLCIAMGIVLLAGYYLFSRQVKNERFTKINFDVTVRLQDKMPKRLDEYWEDIGFFVSPVPSAVIIGVLTLAWLVTGRRKKQKAAALMIPVFFALLVAGEVYGKAKVESPAPPFFMLKHPTTIFPTYYVQEQYSYPSGHAARAIYMIGIFVLLLVNRYGVTKKTGIAALLSLGFFLTVFVGKMYLGHHWLSDMIGGTVLGLAMLSFPAGALLDIAKLRPVIRWVNTTWISRV